MVEIKIFQGMEDGFSSEVHFHCVAYIYVRLVLQISILLIKFLN